MTGCRRRAGRRSPDRDAVDLVARVARVMRPVLGDVDATLRGQPRDAEGREEGMQQGGMIGVTHILEIELPVVVQNLRGRAEDL